MFEFVPRRVKYVHICDRDNVISQVGKCVERWLVQPGTSQNDKNITMIIAE